MGSGILIEEKNEAINRGLKRSSMCALPCLVKPCSKEPGCRSNLTICRRMNRENELYIHNGILITSKEKWNPIIYGNTEELGTKNVKWSKPSPERTSHDFTPMQFETADLREVENRVLVSRSQRRKGGCWMMWESILVFCYRESNCM